MNSHRLLRAATSFLIVTTLTVVPWNVALAAPEEAESAGEESEEPADGGEAEAEQGGDDAAEEAAPEEGEEAGEGGEGEGTDEAAEGEEEPAEEEPAEEEAEAEEPAPKESAEPEPEPEGPERPDEPRWGKENQHPMKGTGMIIAGTATTVGGIGFIVAAFVATTCHDGSEPGCKNAENRTLLVPTAIAATGTGLLFLGVGLGMRRAYKKWENWSPEQAMVSPTLLEDGGGLSVTGRF